MHGARSVFPSCYHFGHLWPPSAPLPPAPSSLSAAGGRKALPRRAGAGGGARQHGALLTSGRPVRRRSGVPHLRALSLSREMGAADKRSILRRPSGELKVRRVDRRLSSPLVSAAQQSVAPPALSASFCPGMGIAAGRGSNAPQRAARGRHSVRASLLCCDLRWIGLPRWARQLREGSKPSWRCHSPSERPALPEVASRSERPSHEHLALPALRPIALPSVPQLRRSGGCGGGRGSKRCCRARQGGRARRRPSLRLSPLAFFCGARRISALTVSERDGQIAVRLALHANVKGDVAVWGVSSARSLWPPSSPLPLPRPSVSPSPPLFFVLAADARGDKAAPRRGRRAGDRKTARPPFNLTVFAARHAGAVNVSRLHGRGAETALCGAQWGRCEVEGDPRSLSALRCRPPCAPLPPRLCPSFFSAAAEGGEGAARCGRRGVLLRRGAAALSPSIFEFVVTAVALDARLEGEAGAHLSSCAPLRRPPRSPFLPQIPLSFVFLCGLRGRKAGRGRRDCSL